MTVKELQKILEENPEVTDIEFETLNISTEIDGSTYIYLSDYDRRNFMAPENVLYIW